MGAPRSRLFGACSLLLLLATGALGEDILIKAGGNWRSHTPAVPPSDTGCTRRRPTRLVPTALLAACALLHTLQGGTVVNADRQFKADVLIRDGLIVKVAPGLKVRRVHALVRLKMEGRRGPQRPGLH